MNAADTAVPLKLRFSVRFLFLAATGVAIVFGGNQYLHRTRYIRLCAVDPGDYISKVHICNLLAEQGVTYRANYRAFFVQRGQASHARALLLREAKRPQTFRCLPHHISVFSIRSNGTDAVELAFEGGLPVNAIIRQTAGEGRDVIAGIQRAGYFLRYPLATNIRYAAREFLSADGTMRPAYEVRLSLQDSSRDRSTIRSVQLLDGEAATTLRGRGAGRNVEAGPVRPITRDAESRSLLLLHDRSYRDQLLPSN